MRGRASTSTIYTTILPKQSYLGRICTKKLSKEAKHRLKIIDYFFHQADKNISLTARHFGVTRGYVYKWLNRFNPRCLESLEDIYSIKVPKYSLCTVEILEAIAEITGKINREISVVIDRKGKVLSVVVGDSSTVEIPIINIKDYKGKTHTIYNEMVI